MPVCSSITDSPEKNRFGGLKKNSQEKNGKFENFLNFFLLGSFYNSRIVVRFHTINWDSLESGNQRARNPRQFKRALHCTEHLSWGRKIRRTENSGSTNWELEFGHLNVARMRNAHNEPVGPQPSVRIHKKASARAVARVLPVSLRLCDLTVLKSSWLTRTRPAARRC